MLLARVKGSVVSTHKPDDLVGLKLRMIEKINPRTLEGKGDFVVALDAVGAAVNEIVYYVTGSSARYTETSKGKPTDATIVGIVDDIEIEGKLIYRKSEEK